MGRVAAALGFASAASVAFDAAAVACAATWPEFGSVFLNSRFQPSPARNGQNTEEKHFDHCLPKLWDFVEKCSALAGGID